MKSGVTASLRKPQSSLRTKILVFVLGLIFVTLVGSALSLLRITDVNRTLEEINQGAIPLGKALNQLQADSEVFRREVERLMSLPAPPLKSVGLPISTWMTEVIGEEIKKVNGFLVSRKLGWSSAEVHNRWIAWGGEAERGYFDLIEGLKQVSKTPSSQSQAEILKNLSAWARQIQWGAAEYDHTLRSTLNQAQGRISDLRTGLELLLAVVVGLSLLLLWLGERALRPLAQLADLARAITVRGLRKEDKAALPALFSIRSKSDEVSHLAREFHTMATSLLEREKEVEAQRRKVEDQNRLLQEMGSLNQNILMSIESVLFVFDPTGKITGANPAACAWLGEVLDRVLGTTVGKWDLLTRFVSPSFFGQGSEAHSRRIEPTEVDGKIFGGMVTPLLEKSQGLILVLHDLTEEMELEKRVRQAESLAAIGRMSAQVAHEIRNPLHSVGLEAEMALEALKSASLGGSPGIRAKASLLSIMESVERLEKITQNYLRMSKTGATVLSHKGPIDLVDVLERVLATYSSLCEAHRIKIDWILPKRENQSARVLGDPGVLEQVLGNLHKNAIQELERVAPGVPRKIIWAFEPSESEQICLTVSDSGRGISAEMKAQLFKPFATSKAEGTGLGLSFARQVIEDHGGRLDVREGTTAGACFEIVLPRFAGKEMKSPSPEVSL